VGQGEDLIDLPSTRTLKALDDPVAIEVKADRTKVIRQVQANFLSRDSFKPLHTLVILFLFREAVSVIVVSRLLCV
jgi:hypothetical protein